MYSDFHDIIDDAAIALYTEGVSEKKVRDAVISSLLALASSELGPLSELASILDESRSDIEIMEDLREFNSWETPNERDNEDGGKAR